MGTPTCMLAWTSVRVAHFMLMACRGRNCQVVVNYIMMALTLSSELWRVKSNPLHRLRTFVLTGNNCTNCRGLRCSEFFFTCKRVVMFMSRERPTAVFDKLISECAKEKLEDQHKVRTYLSRL